ncbi:hypothetical protein Tco_1300295, partial [Tanacetum coccineum]
RGQIATVEATEAARASELDGLKERNAALEGQMSYDELSIRAASLESEKDKLIDQEVQVKALSDRLAGLDSDLMSMALHLDEEFYPRFLTTIDEQRWIFSRGMKLVVMKCLQSSDYLAAFDALRTVDFPLLAQLESQKDASIVDIMGLHHLEGSAADIPEANQLQPSPEQLMLPIHRPEDQVVIGETSLSFSMDVPLSAENLVGKPSTFGVPATATTTALSTTFIQTSSVPPISVADYEVLGAEPSAEVPSPLKIVLEKEELESTLE